MRTFSINDPVFDGIRQTQGLNAIALQNFVNAVNTNAVVNEMFQVAGYNGDIGIRLVDPVQLNGNGAQYQPFKTTSTANDYFNDKYEIQLSKSWFVDADSNNPATYTRTQNLSTNMLVLGHELNHYSNQAVYDAAKAVRDEPSLNPGLTAVERSVKAVRMVMEAEVDGWYKGLETLRAEQAAGRINDQVFNRYTQLGFAESRLTAIETAGIALGLSGDELSRYVSENGVSVIAQMGNYLAVNVAAYSVPQTDLTTVSKAVAPASLDPNQIREHTETYYADGSVVSDEVLNNGTHITRINDPDGGIYSETISKLGLDDQLHLAQINTIDASDTCRREDYSTNAAGEQIVTRSVFSGDFDSPVDETTTTTTRTDGSKTENTSYPDGSTETHAYDADGRLASEGWQDSDGSYGSSNYNIDGSSTTTTYDAETGVNGYRVVAADGIHGNRQKDTSRRLATSISPVCACLHSVCIRVHVRQKTPNTTKSH
jgi:hypothetical protein